MSEKKKDTNPDSILTTMNKLPLPFYLFVVVAAVGLGGIHGFYPNLSKFFQERFNYDNEEAARITAAPYMVGSIVTPLSGFLLTKVGPNYYEKIIMVSLALLLAVHAAYWLMPNGKGDMWCVVPILVFGAAHSMFTTCFSPMVRKLISETDLLPFCFSMLALVNKMSVASSCYIAGLIR